MFAAELVTLLDGAEVAGMAKICSATFQMWDSLYGEPPTIPMDNYDNNLNPLFFWYFFMSSDKISLTDRASSTPASSISSSEDSGKKLTAPWLLIASNILVKI